MKRIFILFFSLLIILPLSAKDQQEFIEIKTRYGFKIKRRQPLNFSVYLSLDSSTSRPVLYASVSLQNDLLQFKKNGDTYFARYRISIAVRDTDASLLQFSREHQLKLSDFKRTNSLAEHQTHTYRLDNWNRNVEFTQGTYTCLLQVEDLNTRKTAKKNLTLHVTTNLTERQSSPICFLSALPDSSDGFPLSSHLNYLDYNQPYYAYASIKTDSSNIQKIQLELTQGEHTMVDTILEVQPKSGQLDIIYPLPVEHLSEGRYGLKITNGRISENRSFEIVWFRKPVYLYKLDLALRPMRYLLNEEDFERAKDLNQAELTDWFKDFWQHRDPTPKTVFNELLYEFFQRVGESNFKFRSKNREGWETDRGKVFILYGPPDKIENGQYATQSLPYLIWEYKEGSRFIFIDQRRNGEFTLKNTEEEE